MYARERLSNCHTLAGLAFEFKEPQRLGTEGRVIYVLHQIKYVYQLVVDAPLTDSLILLQKIAKMKRAVIGGAR